MIHGETNLAQSKAPLREFIESWKEKVFLNLHFFKQRNLILKDPTIIHRVDPATMKTWRPSLTFALQSQALILMVITAFQFVVNRVVGPPPETRNTAALEKSLEQTKNTLSQITAMPDDAIVPIVVNNETREYPKSIAVASLQQCASTLKKEIKVETATRASFEAAFQYLQPVFIGATLLLTSGFFKRGIIKKYGDIGFSNAAAQCYLYVSTARLFWAGIIMNIWFLMLQWGGEGYLTKWPDKFLFIMVLAICPAFLHVDLAVRNAENDLATVLKLPDRAQHSIDIIGPQMLFAGWKCFILMLFVLLALYLLTGWIVNAIVS